MTAPDPGRAEPAHAPTACAGRPAAAGKPGRLLAYAELWLSMTLVGTYVALSKPLTEAVPVAVLAFLRFGIAALVMLPWSLPRAGDPFIGGADRALLFLQSLFGNVLFTFCMLYGVSMTSATSAGVILAALPATVMLGSQVFLGEAIHPRAVWAVLFASGGIGILRLDPAGSASAPQGSWLGDLLVFGAVCCEAIYVIIGKRLAARVDPLRLSAWINLYGLLLVTPFALRPLRVFDFGQLSGSAWALLAYYSLAASVFSVWLWISGLKSVPAHHAAVFTAALPLAATAVGVLFLGEALNPARILAVVLAVTGIVTVSGAGARRAGRVC